MAYFSLRKVGFLIDTFEKPCVLADALVPDCPVIGVSDSFAKLSATAMVARVSLLGWCPVVPPPQL
jgi:hypothetical protein